MNKGTIVGRLIRWSFWRINHGNHLGYPNAVSYIKLAPSTTHFPDPNINIECQATHDAYMAVSMISQAALNVEYLSTAITERQKSLAFGRSRRVYKKCVEQAHIEIDRHLNFQSQQRRDTEDNMLKIVAH